MIAKLFYSTKTYVSVNNLLGDSNTNNIKTWSPDQNYLVLGLH